MKKPRIMKKPRRRFHLSLELGADSIEELDTALNEVHNSIIVDGDRDIVSGGTGSGWKFTVEEDPEMDHDKYFAALKEYRRQKGRLS